MNTSITSLPGNAGANPYSCIDFRREKLADPKRLSPAAHRHVGGCTLCQAFARRIDAVEEKATQQLFVPIPDGLADRIILGATRKQRFNWRLYAMAASMLITIGIGISWIALPLARQDTGSPLLAIEHVLHEPESLLGHQEIAPERLQAVFASFGGEIQAPLGTVRYIKLCPVPGGTGWHIVFDTPAGLATLLLVPTDASQVKPAEITYNGMTAMVHPTSFGYWAIISDTPAGTKNMDNALRTKVRWL